MEPGGRGARQRGPAVWVGADKAELWRINLSRDWFQSRRAGRTGALWRTLLDVLSSVLTSVSDSHAAKRTLPLLF